MKNLWIAMMGLGLTLGMASAQSQQTKGSEKAEAAEAAKNAPALAAAVKDATVSLEAGLRASEAEGKPISGKFEIEDGKLQLSQLRNVLVGTVLLPLDSGARKVLIANVDRTRPWPRSSMLGLENLIN